MEIYAKSSLRADNVEAKLAIGCDGIEIQLLGELEQGLPDLTPLADYPIRVVHSPLSGAGECNLEELCCSNRKLLEQCFHVANWFGKRQGRTIPVILHTELGYKNWQTLTAVREQIVREIDRMFTEYPWTELVIENVTFFNDKPEFHLCNNTFPADVRMVEELRDRLGDRVGSLLDTCHAIMTYNYVTLLRSRLPYTMFDPEVATLKEWFRWYAPTLKLIHLADARNGGWGSEHGLPFDEGDATLRGIVQLYKEYECTCPISIEVRENDYFKNPNYRKTKEALEAMVTGES